MGWINSRGTRAKPRYVVYFAEGLNADGSKRYVSAKAPGARNKDDAKLFLATCESRVGQGLPGILAPKVSTDMADLLSAWAVGLGNRSARADRWIITRDLVPAWKGVDAASVDVPSVVRWLDRLAGSSMSGQTQLHRFNLLSRFFGWACERGHAPFNPCSSVKRGRRPKAVRSDAPYLEDDAKILPIVKALEARAQGLGLMFYVAHYSGMREGEVAGLTIADMEFLGDGAIRVARSYNGPLKEDKAGAGKSKMVPAPADVEDMLRLHLMRRKLNKAGPDDLVFLYDGASRKRKGVWVDWKGFHPHTIQAEWTKVRRELMLPDGLTWYHATRTTFVTKSLQAGVSLDEVSAAIGHSSPVVTQKYYNRWVRTTYGQGIRRGLRGAG